MIKNDVSQEGRKKREGGKEKQHLETADSPGLVSRLCYLLCDHKQDILPHLSLRLSINKVGIVLLAPLLAPITARVFAVPCHAKSLQSCPILCDPTDCSPPGFSVREIVQARILEWVAISSSRGSSRPRD